MQFQTGNIVHVIGFTSSTSTGEVVATDARECCRLYTVHFDDGETTEFIEDDLRLATDAELVVYLRGHAPDFVSRTPARQPFAVGQSVLIAQEGHPFDKQAGRVEAVSTSTGRYRVYLHNASFNGWFSASELQHSTGEQA